MQIRVRIVGPIQMANHWVFSTRGQAVGDRHLGESVAELTGEDAAEDRAEAVDDEDQEVLRRRLDVAGRGAVDVHLAATKKKPKANPCRPIVAIISHVGWPIAESPNRRAQATAPRIIVFLIPSLRDDERHGEHQQQLGHLPDRHVWTARSSRAMPSRSRKKSPGRSRTPA